MTTAMWSLIDRGDIGELAKALDSDPDLVYIRSEDGRGPLFWAYEYERYDLVKLLLDKGKWPALRQAKYSSTVIGYESLRYCNESQVPMLLR